MTPWAPPARPIFVIRVQPLPGVDPVRFLRHLLKRLLRDFGMKTNSALPPATLASESRSPTPGGSRAFSSVPDRRCDLPNREKAVLARTVSGRETKETWKWLGTTEVQ